MPYMIYHQLNEFGAGDLYLSGIVEDRVMIPLMASHGHIETSHAKGELVLRFVKAFSEEVMRLASSGIEDAQFPQTPLAHTVIPFKGGQSVILGGHVVIIS